jgi:hypothetical protein
MQEGSTGPQEESTREESWEGSTNGGESFTDQQDGWGGLLGESEGWDSQQREEGDSAAESEGWHGPQDGSIGSTGPMGLQEGPVDGSEGYNGLQREQDEPVGTSMGEPISNPMGNPTGKPTGKPTGEPIGGPTGIGESTVQFCSSCNQKKPLIDFGRFLTYNAYRQRNTKANRVRKAKQKATIPPRPKATKEQLEYAIQAWGNTSEYILRGKFTRPLTIEDYLNNKSSPPLIYTTPNKLACEVKAKSKLAPELAEGRPAQDFSVAALTSSQLQY